MAAFGRDPASSQQVWSAETGYPGDSRYREFYRDLGYDLEYDYIKPYLHQDGVRRKSPTVAINHGKRSPNARNGEASRTCAT